MNKYNYRINKDFPIHKNVLKRLKKKLAYTLYEKLLTKKRELASKPLHSKNSLSVLSQEKKGDQVDQFNQMQEEDKYTKRLKRDALLLNQILIALERMQNGRYGICDQTEETIDAKRLLSIPWTRLSLEGAEIEEESNKTNFLSI
ncbi:MAG: TraR/DksA family transcriptional regulator [Bdellovibrionales bacterium]|nr:TraR/DksA family transcriptional regulator [Bdellovibrionales bacterium]